MSAAVSVTPRGAILSPEQTTHLKAAPVSSAAHRLAAICNSIGDTINTNTNWTSSVTGRVGAAFDRLLIYGKGGVAFARDQSGFTDLAGNSASTTFMRTGWTAGAGLEYGISKNWSAKIEYDYLGFGSQALNFTTPTTPLYTSNASLNVQEIKAGLNFRFGGP